MCLQQVSKSTANCHFRKKIPLLPNKCLSLPSFPFIGAKSLLVLMKVKWMIVRGWMGGRGPQSLWGVRMHKLITSYWWKTAHLNQHTFVPLPSSLLSVFAFIETTEHKSMSNLHFSGIREKAINRTFDGNSVWLPRMNIIRKWRCSLNIKGQNSMPSL